MIRQKSIRNGFTLAEVLITTAIVGFLVTVTSGINLTLSRTNARLESTQRKRQDWARTSQFIESEVALSERVITDPKLIDSNTCNNKEIKDSNFRFAIDFGPGIPLSIYHIDEVPSGSIDYTGTLLLKRCGPNDGQTGQFLQTIGEEVDDQVLVDGMVDSCQIDPSTISPKISEGGYGKTLSFQLCLKGSRGSNYSQNLYTYSRINPVNSFPRNGSVCNYDAFEGFRREKDGTSSAETLTATTVFSDEFGGSLICGNGGGDVITGSDGDDILEAGDASGGGTAKGATIVGGLGNDRLLGNTGNDSIKGGSGDDVLIGGGGGDDMSSDSGINSYLPGSGNSIITGGINRDTLYLYEKTESVTIEDGCTTDKCIVKFKRDEIPSSVSLESVELIIFEDGRYIVDKPDT